jgi:hypothetical protein
MADTQSQEKSVITGGSTTPQPPVIWLRAVISRPELGQPGATRRQRRATGG